MKITVIGGSGLIGTKLVSRLREKGHEVLAASPKTGVNSVTGEGLAAALEGARVVIDVANSPSFEGQVAMEFFARSYRNLMAAEATAGTAHHVALSVVGAERLLPDSGYMKAKVEQERLIKGSGIPYTIVRSTQFFEFTGTIVQSGTVGQTVRLSPALYQPIAANDVAEALTDVALSPPLNGTIEIAGPDRVPIDDLARQFLSATHDSRTVIADTHSGYFGVAINDRTLTPGENPRIGPTRFEDWLNRTSTSR